MTCLTEVNTGEVVNTRALGDIVYSGSIAQPTTLMDIYYPSVSYCCCSQAVFGK